MIFERHYAAIFRFCARRIGTRDAADVASEVFVKAFRIRWRFDPDRRDALPWLYGIAINTVGDRLRSFRRQQRGYLYVESPDVSCAEEEADCRIAAEMVRRSLNRALAGLSSRDRNTLLLYALEDLTYEEVAAVLGIPVGTVGSRLARARDRMRQAIPDLQLLTDKWAEMPVEDGA